VNRTIHTGVVGSPFLTRIALHEDRIDAAHHEFNVTSIMRGLPLTLKTPVTFFVGENGSGKSTLLEALAWALGFSAQGGHKSRTYAENSDGHALGRALDLSWRQKVADGFFLRAETFFDWVEYLKSTGSRFAPELDTCSHGEGFLKLFEDRFEDGMYLLDEPEAALSPNRCLSFLALIHQLANRRCAQFVIATHSPILLCYPHATILQFSDTGIRQIAASECEHVKLTRDFLNAPERYFRHLFEDEH
jgi:predicted ATPase